jgi:hypothetical protein
VTLREGYLEGLQPSKPPAWVTLRKRKSARQ